MFYNQELGLELSLESELKIECEIEPLVVEKK